MCFKCFFLCFPWHIWLGSGLGYARFDSDATVGRCALAVREISHASERSRNHVAQSSLGAQSDSRQWPNLSTGLDD